MGDRLLTALPIHLEEHVIGLLHSNEVACTVRLVNKTSAAHYRSPVNIVRISQPVPHHAFKHICEANSRAWLKTLSLQRRLRLVCLTAASGDLANLEVALSSTGCVLRGEMMEAAAAAGHLHVCQWLRQQGCRMGSALSSAAGAGRREVCEWLLASDCPGIRAAAYAAARGGHLGLMEWLRQQLHPSEKAGPDDSLVTAVAYGCDLPALQRYYSAWRDESEERQRQLQQWQAEAAGGQEQQEQEQQQQVAAAGPAVLRKPDTILSSACGSPSPNWRDKVLWLEDQGFPPAPSTCAEVARRTDGVDRLRWLRQRGYPLEQEVVEAAAEHGNTAALEYLMEEARVRWQGSRPAELAASGGHLAALQIMHTRGCPLGSVQNLLSDARACGHLPVVSWLADTFGLTATDLQDQVAGPAIRTGEMQVMDWLAERGCDLTGVSRVLANAARGGSEVMLERLVAFGCPWPDSRGPYLYALFNGDLATLRCLRRLDCPWGPDGSLISTALVVDNTTPVLPGLRCLVEMGCPIDWGAALEDAKRFKRVPKEVVDWLERGPQGG